MNAKKLADMFADWLPMDSPERAANLARYMDGSAVREPHYHGTTNTLGPYGVFMRGQGGYIYTTPSPEYASEFAGDMGAVYPLHVSMKKPLDLRELGPESVRASELRELLKSRGVNASFLDGLETDAPVHRFVKFDEMKGAARDAGYDGIQIRERARGKEADASLLFEPEQVKSRFNSGRYDGQDPIINRSALPYALAGGGLMSALSPSDAAAIESIRQKDAPLEEAWNPVEAFGGGLGGGLRAALAGIIPDGVTDWAISGLMSGGK